MPVETEKSVNVALVGAGLVGQLAHLANYAQIPGCRVAAIAEARPRMRELVREKYDIPRAVENHRELLSEESLGGFVVVTRRHHAGQIALDILNAGKPLLTEKPMAATLDQAERLAATARENKVSNYAVGFMRRHDEGVQLAKQTLDNLIASEELGPILYARIHCFGGEAHCSIDGFVDSGEARIEDLPGWPRVPDWLTETLHEAYDTFMNIYSHDINLLHFLFGAPRAVEHASLKGGGAGIVQFDMGSFPLELVFGTMLHDDWDEGVEIVFRRGRLVLDLPPAFHRNSAARVRLYHGIKGQLVEFSPRWSWSFRRQAEWFISALRGGNPPLTSCDDAISDMRLIDVIWRRIAAS